MTGKSGSDSAALDAGEVSAMYMSRLVAMSRVIIKVTAPRLSQEGRGSTDAHSAKLNPATVWHHPKKRVI
jgi:hypothetical protein